MGELMLEVIIWIMGIAAPFIAYMLFDVSAKLVDSREEVDRLDSKNRLLKPKSDSLDKLSGIHLSLLETTLKKGMTSSNLVTTLKRFDTALKKLSKIGVKLSDHEAGKIKRELETVFKDIVRKEAAKQMQAEIKAKIREEQREEKLLEQEMRRIEREGLAVKKALEVALRKAGDTHSAEVDALKAKLREAVERMQRAKSMAQQTRAGHVYVISNIGSFGENVYKVGMTRRLEPMDRVKELGDASVPFLFDVHMMISCDDAPTLEKRLHEALNQHRVNKVNSRKEFFNVGIDSIVSLVHEHHGKVEYKAEPDAFEYRESREMTDKDMQYIESITES